MSDIEIDDKYRMLAAEIAVHAIGYAHRIVAEMRDAISEEPSRPYPDRAVQRKHLVYWLDVAAKAESLSRGSR